jgi:hypothetical protein
LEQMTVAGKWIEGTVSARSHHEFDDVRSGPGLARCEKLSQRDLFAHRFWC